MGALGGRYCATLDRKAAECCTGTAWTTYCVPKSASGTDVLARRFAGKGYDCEGQGTNQAGDGDEGGGGRRRHRVERAATFKRAFK